MWMSFRYYEQKLTENTPQLGYFIAGGMAGAVSRTATAPLDRLKVYLIAKTSSGAAAVHAAKGGAPVKAAATASKTLVDAVKELWRAGGIRSLFAGMLILQTVEDCADDRREWVERCQGHARISYQVRSV
jgi:solute carrier family 25 phosphate transporter 23/24/25/41